MPKTQAAQNPPTVNNAEHQTKQPGVAIAKLRCSGHCIAQRKYDVYISAFCLCENRANRRARRQDETSIQMARGLSAEAKNTTKRASSEDCPAHGMRNMVAATAGGPFDIHSICDLGARQHPRRPALGDARHGTIYR